MLKHYNPLRYLKFQLNILLALEESFILTIVLLPSLDHFLSKFIFLRAHAPLCPARPRQEASAAAQCHLLC